MGAPPLAKTRIEGHVRPIDEAKVSEATSRTVDMIDNLKLFHLIIIIREPLQRFIMKPPQNFLSVCMLKVSL